MGSKKGYSKYIPSVLGLISLQCLLFFVGIGIGQADGFGRGKVIGMAIQKKIDLVHCKKAGWEFIEEKIFPRRLIKESIFGEEYALERLRNLQASMATKCIVRIDD